MSEGPANLVARHVHDLIERQRLDALPDHALLRRALTGDDGAFAALVRRHGTLVLGTCRRILRHVEDAEDACQAVFLVLARKGSAIRADRSLAGWLHRVAVRAACRLRRQRARRTAEPLPAEVPGPAHPDELVWKEVRGAFDAEVGRLPDRFRLPLVLCCLQGKTRAEAAAELGWSEGAVRGRLERGRKLLRGRFTRKGLTLPAALLPLLVEQAAPATGLPASVAPSSAAARLADGLLRSMAVARAKLAAWATAAVLLVGTAIGIGVYHPASAQPGPAVTPPPAPGTPGASAADAEKNLDTFVLRVSLAPKGEGKFDPRFSLYHVLLYVPNLRLEPPANGPDGKPTEAFARITKDEAKKVLAALDREGFFAKRGRTELLVDTTGPHATFALRYQGGEDPIRRKVVYPWDASMLKALDTVRAAVTGDAAMALDRLLAQLADERKKWAPDPLADDLKRLQGTWAMYQRAEHEVIDPNESPVAKVTFDGKSITFKAKIQYKPKLDLETIRGTFELADGVSRKLVVQGVRDTVAKQEPITWTLPYEFVGNQLRIIAPPSPSDPPAPNPAKAERLFIMTRQAPTPAAGEWGKSSEGLRLRIRSDTDRLGAFGGPAIAVDVKHEADTGKPNPPAVRAGRLWSEARLEVDGVWYRARDRTREYLPQREVRAGEEIKDWVILPLEAGWVQDRGDTQERPLLQLVPGKHTVRVNYTFWKGSPATASTSPVSGPLEIVIPAAAAKVGAVESKWGESSDGIRARIRTAKPRFITGEVIRIDYDVKADAEPANRHWSAGIVGSHARVEVDGTWYVFNATTFEFPIQNNLQAGQEVAPWTMVRLDGTWVAEKTDPPVKLALKPGKHTLRVEFAFRSDSTKPPTARPVSSPLEVEVAPETPTDIGWRPAKIWKPFPAGGATDLAAPDDKRLFTVGKDGLILWDLSGPAPKQEHKVGYTVNGLTFAGLDRDGLPLLVRRSNRPHPMRGEQAELSVLHLPEMDETLKPQFGVMADSLRSWAVRPDGKELAVLLTGWRDVRIVDVGTGKERVMEAPKGESNRFAFPHRLLFSPDGKLLVGLGSNDYPVTGKKNGLVVCWNPETGKLLWQAEEPDGQSVGVVSRNGRVLVTSGRLGRVVNVWDLATGKKARELPANGVSAVGVSPDGKTVAVGTSTDTDPRMPILEVWNLNEKAGAPVRMPAALRAVTFAADGRSLATADQNGEVRWWVKQ